MPRRWQIALLVSAAIAISYLDRQTLPVAIAAIQRDIKITNTQFSQLQAAFLFAYALLYAGGGKLIDWLGTRRGFFCVMVFWSLACASHGLATGFWMLMISRFLLGMGEGGGFPAATKAVFEWFPVRERATAMGVINAGSAVGSVIAPPAIYAIIVNLNWRWVFFICGALGLLWTVWWQRSYYAPAQPPNSAAPTQVTESDALAESVADASAHKIDLPWLRLFSFQQVWGLVCAKFLSDAAWYFYLFWLPKYLYDARGFDTKQVGYFAWIPYAASGLGSLLGGWCSSHLLQRGNNLNFSRKLVLGVSAIVMPLIVFVTQVPVELTVVLFSIAFAGQQSWSTIVMILPTDLFPHRVVGSVAGLIGFGGAMGGVVFSLIAGRMLDSGLGYGKVFAIVGTFHVLAFLLLLFTIRDIRPIEIK